MTHIPDCPVLTERTGEPSKHILHSHRGYCKRCPTRKDTPVNDARSMCHRLHRTYRYCNSCCDYSELDWHPCDQIISIYIGSWPHYTYCDKKGIELRDEYSVLGEKREKGKRWLCRKHFPENIEQQTVERHKRENVRFEAGMYKSRYGWVGKDYEEILLEMAKWMAANTELVEADEWLGKVSRMMADDSHLMEALEKS